jgi:uncharacterized protein YecT (DUF1311 family)
VRNAAVLILCLLAGPAAAQPRDCSTAATQLDASTCARENWEAADADLNAAYAAARDRMRQVDAGLPEADRGAETALRDAQRAWIPFRDQACAAEGFLYRGGSIEPMIVALCLERLTRARTADLQGLVQGM